MRRRRRRCLIYGHRVRRGSIDVRDEGSRPDGGYSIDVHPPTYPQKDAPSTDDSPDPVSISTPRSPSARSTQACTASGRASRPERGRQVRPRASTSCCGSIPGGGRGGVRWGGGCLCSAGAGLCVLLVMVADGGRSRRGRCKQRVGRPVLCGCGGRGRVDQCMWTSID